MTKVSRVNHAPTLASIPDQSVNEGDVLSVTPTATDPDGDPLTWSLVNPAPAGMQINPDTGTILWQTAAGMGHTTNRITVQVLDNGIPRLRQSSPLPDYRSRRSIARRNCRPFPTEPVERQILTIPTSALDPDLPAAAPPISARSRAPRSEPALMSKAASSPGAPTTSKAAPEAPISIVVTDDGTPSFERYPDVAHQRA